VKAPASVSHEMVKTSTGGRGRGTSPRVRGEPKDGKDLHGGARPGGTSPRVRGEPKDGKDLHGGGAAGVEAPRPYGGGFLDRGGPVGIQGTAYIYLVLTTG
jgi:hypothetical protein